MVPQSYVVEVGKGGREGGREGEREEEKLRNYRGVLLAGTRERNQSSTGKKRRKINSIICFLINE